MSQKGRKSEYFYLFEDFGKRHGVEVDELLELAELALKLHKAFLESEVVCRDP